MNDDIRDAVRQWLAKADNDWRQIPEKELQETLDLTDKFAAILLPLLKSI